MPISCRYMGVTRPGHSRSGLRIGVTSLDASTIGVFVALSWFCVLCDFYAEYLFIVAY